MIYFSHEHHYNINQMFLYPSFSSLIHAFAMAQILCQVLEGAGSEYGAREKRCKDTVLPSRVHRSSEFYLAFFLYKKRGFL